MAMSIKNSTVAIVHSTCKSKAHTYTPFCALQTAVHESLPNRPTHTPVHHHL